MYNQPKLNDFCNDIPILEKQQNIIKNYNYDLVSSVRMYQLRITSILIIIGSSYYKLSKNILCQCCFDQYDHTINSFSCIDFPQY